MPYCNYMISFGYFICEGTFILYAKFPETYPEKPPEIRFETPVSFVLLNPLYLLVMCSYSKVMVSELA